jgi:hypothetical protein
MAERGIVSIVWHQKGDQVDLHYLEGEPDRLVGAETVVAALAASVGLTIVPSPPGTIHWVRDPETGTDQPPGN